MSIRQGNNIIAGVNSGLNVGDIFYTKRNDNNLNGAVECNGATYNTTDFTGAQSIGALLEAGKIDYISLTAYANAITQKGWCDKIGWNGTGNTQFRVPTLNAYIWQKLQMGVIGTGVLKFQNGSYLNSHNESLGDNAGWVKTKNSSGSWSSQGDLAVSNDPSVSNLVAGTSTDISQQRVMIQLATATTDEALETCTGVLADVAALKYDYVVDFQRPTSANNYTWYRKYKSGWVEQGGYAAVLGQQNTTITLPVEMADTNYVVQITNDFNNASNQYGSQCNGRSTTQIIIKCGSYSSGDQIHANWQVSGMSAS